MFWNVCYLARSPFSIPCGSGPLRPACPDGLPRFGRRCVMDGFEVTAISATTALTSLKHVRKKRASPRRPTTSLSTIRWN